MLRKRHYCFWTILLFLLFVVQMAEAQDVAKYSTPSITNDSIPVAVKDTVSVKKDSIKSNAITAPIKSHAKDSIVLVLDGKNMFYLYGEAKVTQEQRELTAEYMELNADSSLIYATYGLDSVKQEIGYPVFKEGEQQYEMKSLHFNFKTKKMYIHDVVTQQGEGFVTAGTTKRMPNEDLNMLNGKYTTCDQTEDPHWYFQMSRAKVRPGKNVVAGPAYLVLEDVPTPIAVPFAFFPFTKDYSSGIIVPTFDSEMTRGFSLQRGGYYFALNDYMDLRLTGDIFTKGSWGLNAASTYRKRYKFSGSFNASYTVTLSGDKDTKDLPNTDYRRTQDMRVSWTHTQDPKANPFSTFSAGVDFATTQSRLNNLEQYYDANQRTQGTRSSNVTYSFRRPPKPFSVNANFSINQVTADTTLNVTFLNVGFTLSQINPFKRKEQVGDQKWYEKINLSYTGNLKNNSGNIKEYEFLKKNMIKDWNNGMSHSIPVSATFNLMKYITITPNVNYTGAWYTKKVIQGFRDNKLVPVDTLYGFYWIHTQLSGGVSVNTKLYGIYKPLPIFGKWTKGIQIRHVFTPSISFSGSPDMSQWGGAYQWARGSYLSSNGIWSSVRDTSARYSPFRGQIFGIPGTNKSAFINIAIDNNLEMKIPIAGTDSARKVSLIDNLHLGTGYNFLAPGDSLNWQNLNASIRLKILGQTLNLGGTFDIYEYDEYAHHINKLRWTHGGGIGRFMGTSIGYPLSLNNDVIKKWFGKGNDKNAPPKNNTGEDENSLSNEDEVGNSSDNSTDDNSKQSTSLLAKKKTEGNYDEDGYLLTDIPWNLSLNYSLSYAYGSFNKDKREYNYKFTQTLSLSGNITPTKGWDFSFSTSYNFDLKQFATLQCNISRKMHCWQITASLIPIGPYQSYNFMVSVASSLLKDLKYQQSSNYRDQMKWGN